MSGKNQVGVEVWEIINRTLQVLMLPSLLVVLLLVIASIMIMMKPSLARVKASVPSIFPLDFFLRPKMAIKLVADIGKTEVPIHFPLAHFCEKPLFWLWPAAMGMGICPAVPAMTSLGNMVLSQNHQQLLLQTI